MATVRNQSFFHLRGQGVGTNKSAGFDRVVCNQMRILDQIDEVGAAGSAHVSVTTTTGPWPTQQTFNIRVDKIGPHSASLRLPVFSVATGGGTAVITAPADTLTGIFEPDLGEAQQFAVLVNTENVIQIGLLTINTDGSFTVGQDLDNAVFTDGGDPSGLNGGTIVYNTSGANGTFTST